MIIDLLPKAIIRRNSEQSEMSYKGCRAYFESIIDNPYKRGREAPFYMDGGEGGMIRAARSPLRGRPAAVVSRRCAPLGSNPAI
jgi:hypothetical protein